jgi:hypothetical protein
VSAALIPVLSAVNVMILALNSYDPEQATADQSPPLSVLPTGSHLQWRSPWQGPVLRCRI